MTRLCKLFPLMSVLLVLAFATTAQAGGLFFSEYVEGSSYNKCVEIYNNTGAIVDLTQVTIQLYSNGNAVANSVASLTGSLNPGDVVVVCNPNIADPSPADILSGTVNYNGDDAFELLYNGVTQDVIGQIGVDPGSTWGVAPTTTANATLRRKAGVCQGDTNGSDPFDPSLEWDGYPIDTLDGLGSYTGCSGVATESQSWGGVKALFD